MYTAIKGIFRDGQIFLQETPPTTQITEVVVMFMEATEPENAKRGVRLGSLAGQGYSIPDDFNAPLDDLKDYM